MRLSQMKCGYPLMPFATAREDEPVITRAAILPVERLLQAKRIFVHGHPAPWPDQRVCPTRWRQADRLFKRVLVGPRYRILSLKQQMRRKATFNARPLAFICDGFAQVAGMPSVSMRIVETESPTARQQNATICVLPPADMPPKAAHVYASGQARPRIRQRVSIRSSSSLPTPSPTHPISLRIRNGLVSQ